MHAAALAAVKAAKQEELQLVQRTVQVVKEAERTAWDEAQESHRQAIAAERQRYELLRLAHEADMARGGCL